jgi:hypothetical protein
LITRPDNLLKQHAPDKPQPFRNWLYKTVVREKLLNLPGIILFLLTAVLIAYGITGIGTGFILAILVLIVGLPIVYAIVFIPEFGILCMLVLAYFLLGIMRLGIDFPLGTLMDGIELLLLISIFIRKEKPEGWKILKDPVSIMIFIWVSYNIMEVANPAASSVLAWLYTIRSVAIVMLMYFVFRYHIRSIALVRIILRCWLFLAFLAALYALKQEYFGFFSFETAWLNSDPNISDLLFIDGHWRKFSFMSDPVAFSYNMVTGSILAICMIGTTKKLWIKAGLVLLAGFLLFAMSFSGTRGAYVLIPVALFFYTILNFNKYVFAGAIITGLGLFVLIFMPTSNVTLYRFQSAFRPSQDASYLLRRANQEKIKPFIITHPLGGGLGATGTWGERFAPDSFLAHFPPDSGYVRVAVELGWLGLLLFCTLMFVMLRQSIRNLFRIRDPEIKSYCLAMTLIIFVLNVGNYPQEALVQYPTSVYFYLVAAIAGICWQLDKNMHTKNQDGK